MSSVDVAAEYLDRNSSSAAGHRFVPQPHTQSSASGDTIVRFQHDFHGIPVLFDDTAIHVGPDGARGNVPTPSWTVGTRATVEAREAVAAAVEHFRRGSRKRPCRVAHGALLRSRKTQPAAVATFPLPSRPFVFAWGGRKPITGHLAIVDADGPALAWVIRLPIRIGIEYLVAVSAGSGEVILCAPWSAAVRCSAMVYRNSPDEGPRAPVDFPLALNSYPPGLQSHPFAAQLADWMDDAHMVGNCVEMFAGNSSKTLTAATTAAGLSLAPNDATGAEQCLVNAFFLCNYLHDFFLMLGFGEAEGNFQLKNPTQGGRAGDRLRVFVFDSVMDIPGSMTARDDGIPGELVLAKSKGAKRPAALDADVVIHEFTHGVSHRLVGGRLGFHALIDEQSIAVDEGWSDYFAMTVQNAARNAPKTTFATYTTSSAAGMRMAAYDEHYPATYGRLGKGAYKQPIAAAEVWAVALIRMNTLIGQELHAPLRGHEIGWRAVIESMKLVPKNPNFIHARDATLDGIAALRTASFITAAEQQSAVTAAKTAFSERGLGPAASSSGTDLKDAREDLG